MVVGSSWHNEGLVFLIKHWVPNVALSCLFGGDVLLGMLDVMVNTKVGHIIVHGVVRFEPLVLPLALMPRHGARNWSELNGVDLLGSQE